MIDLLITIIVIGITLVVPVVYWSRHRQHEEKSRNRLIESSAQNIDEPVTLHPVIDPNRCISIGACISACPEGDILGLVDGRARILSPTKCIGHGACQTACPVDAISLVFGTATRGVEIPNVKETFETNVPGLYIAGELGGMGLIRNAVTQGREAVEYLGKDLPAHEAGVFDLVIVGGGPAGLSATLQAKKDNISVITLDQEQEPGGTLLSFPRQKVVMTQEMEIPLYGKVKRGEILKEELLELWQKIISENHIEIKGGHKIESIVREAGHFVVHSSQEAFAAQRVLLTTGRRGSPRKLGVPGEQSSKVAYKLLEPKQYIGQQLLVVGGGDSAIEAALTLSQQGGTTVTLSYRKGSFSRIKERNQEIIKAAIADGSIIMLFESVVKKIDSKLVIIEQHDKIITLPNDYLFVFIGGELPSAFLSKIGVEMQMKFGHA